jgi:hypothetical protein
MGANIHLYPAPIVGESRIFKQTLSVARSALFSEVIICGTAEEALPRIERLGHGRTIRRVGPSMSDRAQGVVGRVLGQLRWSFAVLSAFFGTPIAVVNAHSVAVLPVSFLLSRMRRARLIYDTHELETESASSTGVQGMIYRWIERSLIRKCDAVFVVNESIASWYEQTYRGVHAIVVRNIPDAGRPEHVVNLRRLLAVPEESRLYIHVGNLTSGRSIIAILQAFASEMVNDHVAFLGDGPLLADVRASQSANSNIHWVPPVDSTKVLEYVAGCDAALCLIEPTCLSYELSLPNKALEYVMAGTPFLHTPLPEVARLLQDDAQSWTVPDPQRNLASAVVAVSEQALQEARVRLAAIRLPTWHEESSRMMEKYETLLAKNRGSS